MLNISIEPAMPQRRERIWRPPELKRIFITWRQRGAL
jgi:hypothetical protein